MTKFFSIGNNSFIFLNVHHRQANKLNETFSFETSNVIINYLSVICIFNIIVVLFIVHKNKTLKYLLFKENDLI